MPGTSRELSVAALERLLSSRKTRLVKLTKKRKSLAKNLRKVETQISSLEGRKPTNGTTTVKRKRRRPKNTMSLHEAVINVLKKNKNGYPLSTLSEKVMASGYKSNSSDFKNVLYQCVYKSKAVEHDQKSGLYKLRD